MRVITGDECGLLKESLPEEDEKKGIHRINGGQTMARKHGVVDLCWVEPEHDESFASLSISGVCTVWERSSDDEKGFAKYRQRNQISNVFEATKALHPSTNPIGLFAMKDNNRLCACNAAGKVSIVNMNKESIVNTFDAIKLTDQDDPKKALLTSCAVHAAENKVALGGQERDVTIWDLATGMASWKAKNAKPDPQTLLQQQVWPTSISFIDSNVLVVGSAHKEVRLYDIRQQRRPVAWTPKGMWGHRVTALCPLPNNTLVIGDSAGFLHSMDWRNFQQITGRFVGPSGSIRAVVAHPSEARLAVIGLDRMLRIYDSSKRKQLHSFYLRQRLNCALFGQEPSSHAMDIGAKGAGTEDDDDDDEGNWDQDDKVEDYVGSDNEDEQKADDDEYTEESSSQSGGGNDDDDDNDEQAEEEEESGSEQAEEHDSDNAKSSSDQSNSEAESESSSDEEEETKPRKKAKR